MNNRIASFDFLKLFAMFLVLWGHCIQYFVPEYGGTGDKTIFTYIYSFHMPLFMVMSGYFSCKSLIEITVKGGINIIVKKFKQLIVPCLVAGVVLAVIELVICKLRGDAIVISSILKDYLTSFWFLKSVFLCYLFSIVIIITKKKGLLLSALLLLFIVVSVNVFSIPFLLPSFLFGLVMKKYEGQYKVSMSVMSVISGILFIVLLYYCIIGRHPL